MADDHLKETPLQRDAVFNGNFLQVVRDTVRLPNGHTATREFILHPGAVMVVPLLDDGRLVMERQYRHPLAQVFVEFPAGKLDAGEDRLACAKRELLEETGYTAREWAHAGQLHVAIAYSDEAIDVWFARGLTLAERQLDDEEFLDVITLSPADVLQACYSGHITDAKTLVGALWLQNVLAGQWSLNWQP